MAGVYFFSLIGFMSCNQNPQQRDVLIYQGEVQGTTFTIIYDKNAGELSKSIDSIYKEVDFAFSLWDTSSLLTLVNKATDEIQVNDLFSKVFMLSDEVYELSDGKFNPALYPLISYWGFGAKKEIKDADSNEVSEILKLTNWKSIKLENNILTKSDPLQKLDFNAIAQGYTVDLIAELFESKGIQNYMIEVGGELLVKGKNKSGESWRVGIDKPVKPEEERAIAGVIHIEKGAIATSGNYRKFIEKNGKRYSHTIDATTGFPVENSLLSVTVYAPTAGFADALATAMMALGKDKAIELAEKLEGVEIYLIYSGENNNFETHLSDGLKEIFEER